MIGEALHYLTGVAGPTQVDMDQKLFTVIELDQARLHNISLSQQTELQIVRRQMNRQKIELGKIGKFW